MKNTDKVEFKYLITQKYIHYGICYTTDNTLETTIAFVKENLTANTLANVELWGWYDREVVADVDKIFMGML